MSATARKAKKAAAIATAAVLPAPQRFGHVVFGKGVALSTVQDFINRHWSRQRKADAVLTAVRQWRAAWQAMHDGDVKPPKGKGFEDISECYALAEALRDHDGA